MFFENEFNFMFWIYLYNFVIEFKVQLKCYIFEKKCYIFELLSNGF